MNEQLGFQVVNGEIACKINNQFRPFQDVRQLPEVEMRKTDTLTAEIFRSPINIDGIQGSVNVKAELDPETVGHIVETPLGVVQIVKAYKDGEWIAEKAPLSFGLRFEVHSLDQYYRLQQLEMEYVIGDEVYHSELVNDDPAKTIGWLIDTYSSVPIVPKLLYNNENDMVSVLLPFTLEAVQSVQATIKEKDI